MHIRSTGNGVCYAHAQNEYVGFDGMHRKSVLLAMCNDVESIRLVRECREMEGHFGMHYTNDIIKKEPKEVLRR